MEERRSPTPPAPQTGESTTAVTSAPSTCAQSVDMPSTQMHVATASSTSTSFVPAFPMQITPVVLHVPPPPPPPDQPAVTLHDLLNEINEVKKELEVEKKKREEVEQELARQKRLTSNLEDTLKEQLAREVRSAIKEERQRATREMEEKINSLKEEVKLKQEIMQNSINNEIKGLVDKVAVITNELRTAQNKITVLNGQVQAAAAAAPPAPPAAPAPVVVVVPAAAAPPSPYKQWRQMLQGVMGMAKTNEPARHKISCSLCGYNYGGKKVTTNAHTLHLQRHHNVHPNTDVGPANDGRQWLPNRI